jgi:hypothetical protein
VLCALGEFPTDRDEAVGFIAVGGRAWPRDQINLRWVGSRRYHALAPHGRGPAILLLVGVADARGCGPVHEQWRDSHDVATRTVPPLQMKPQGRAPRQVGTP